MNLSVAICMVLCSDAFALHATSDANMLRSSLQQPRKRTVVCNADSWRTVAAGDLDMALFRDWVQALLQTTESRVRGVAGVLSIYCADEKFVLRGAHFHGTDVHLEGGFVDEAWSAGEIRESTVMVVGSNIDHAALERGLRDCMVSPETLEKKLRALRFAIGDTVECRTQRGWSKARVVDRLYRDESMPAGLVAPYQLLLEEGNGLIYAPEDSKEVVRATRLERLRFAVDDAVECNLGDRWAKGRVVDLMYREPGTVPAMVAPYQIELEESSALIYAPSDSNAVVRKPSAKRLFDPLSLY